MNFIEGNDKISKENICNVKLPLTFVKRYYLHLNSGMYRQYCMHSNLLVS